ncbi:MAG: M6 family metalloprotease domain-containing protein [Prevotella sp.]|nr:M6 family metalloprotease domain-containing protein [Prevotella sp.]
MAICLSINAVPAKRGMWRTITLSDGSQKVVELRGDEHFHFLADGIGNAYVQNEWGTFDKTTIKELLNDDVNSLRAKVRAYTKQIEAEKRLKAPHKASGIPSDKSKFLGKKKGLVILAQYKDVKFSTTTPGQFGCANINALYDKIINTRHLDMEPFYGSVKDYFIDQSDGKFELDFDVVGPVTLSQNRSFYGGNGLWYSSNKNGRKTQFQDLGDMHNGYMVYEAINLSANIQKSDGTAVNFSDYDWDGDGEAEVVYVIYAGQGEADGGADWTIWPHKWSLSAANNLEGEIKSIVSNYSNYYWWMLTSNSNYTQVTTSMMNTTSQVNVITKNGTKIDTYACSNELATNGSNGTQLNGIGTICHEFSHTMGYPDAYDTDYSYTGPQMGSWDLMCNGSYNGSWNGGNGNWSNLDAGYRPCGYTAFERWCAGWIEPIELTDPQKITNMKPLGGTRSGGATDHGEAYVVYMPNSQKNIEGEYYLLENRQYANWDYDLPWFGLLISYVNYNESLWESNGLNTPSTAGFEHLTHFQAGGPDYFAFYEFDTYPYLVNYLPQVFSQSASFYDPDGATLASNFNSWLNSNYSTYRNKVQFYTSNNRELTGSSTPSAYYYGTETRKRTLNDHEIWNIYTNGDDDRTVNFIYRYPQDNVLDLDQNVTSSPDFAKGLYTRVTTNKPLTDGTYNTLWFPFDMSAAEAISFLGDEVQIYRLNDISLDADGHFQLDIVEDTGNGIKAYEPVFVKLEGGTNSINVDYYMQVSNTLSEKEPVKELANGWKMIGTTTYDYVPTGAYFIGTKDGQQGFFKSAGNSKLRAYRAYFVAPNNTQQNISATNRFSFRVSKRNIHNESDELNRKNLDPNDPESKLYIPEDPSSMVSEDGGVPNSIRNTYSNDNGSIYDIFGRKMNENGNNSLTKGIYIQNGKKIIIK